MPVCDYYFNHERSPCSKKALFICRSGSSIAPWVDGCASYTFTSPPSPSLTKRLRPLSKQNRRGFLRISKGGFVTLFAFFLESKDVSSDQLISKHIMVQFCYSRLYLSINIVSCHVLLQTAWKDTTWIENLKTWPIFTR